MTRCYLNGAALVALFLTPSWATADGPATAPQITLAVLLADVPVEAEAVLDLPSNPGDPERGAASLNAADGERLRKAIASLKKLRLAKVLAEPNLMTLSGRPVSFLSGGEVPVSRADGAGPKGVRFVETGTRLNVLPRLRPDGKLHLEVEAEHREIQDSPACTASRLRATAELAPGDVLVLHHPVLGEAKRKHRRVALVVPAVEAPPPPAPGPGAVKITAVAGRVHVRCAHFEATADRLEQDGDRFLLSGKVQFRTGEGAGTPTELTAETLAVRVEAGRLRLRADGHVDRP